MIVPPRMINAHQPRITMAALLRLTFTTTAHPTINSATVQIVNMSAEQSSVRSHKGESEVRYHPMFVPTGLLMSNCSALTPAKMAMPASTNLMSIGKPA